MNVYYRKAEAENGAFAAVPRLRMQKARLIKRIE